MTQHELSVKIKAEARTEDLRPFKEALDAIAQKAEELDGLLEGLSDRLAGNSSLSELLSSFTTTISAENITVDGAIEVEAEVTSARPKEGGLLLPGVTAEVAELTWGKKEDPRIKEVTGVVGKLTFGVGVNDDTDSKHLKGVIGYIKGLRWDTSADDKGVNADNKEVPARIRVASAYLDEKGVEKIKTELNSAKIEFAPLLKLKGENARGAAIDFSEYLAGKIKDAMAQAAIYEPVIKYIDNYSEGLAKEATKKLDIKAVPSMDDNVIANFIEATNKTLSQKENHVIAYADMKASYKFDEATLTKSIKKLYEIIDSEGYLNDPDYYLKVYAFVDNVFPLDKTYDPVGGLGVNAYAAIEDLKFYYGGKEISEEAFGRYNAVEILGKVRIDFDKSSAYGELLELGKNQYADSNLTEESPHFASGKVITVGEGGDDEVIAHRDVLKRGPAYLDRTVAALVKKSEGGTNVYVPDLENTAVIPMNRYAEFMRRIYGGKFAYGQDLSVSGAEGYYSALEALSSAVARMQSINDNTPQSQIDAMADRLNEALRMINANTDELEGIMRSYEQNMANLPQSVRDAILQTVSHKEMYSSILSDISGMMGMLDPQGALNDVAKSIDDTRSDVGKRLEKIETALNRMSASAKAAAPGATMTTTMTTGDGKWDKMKSWVDSDEGKAAIYRTMGRAFGTGADLSETILKKTLGLVQDIYNKLKEASPLLQTVSTLFNLAMRLFFMPLGNKLAEVLIPKTVELVEKVTDMWDMFDENMTLGDMLTKAIDYGFKVFGDYFMDIGDKLQAQGGIVGQIGHMLSTIGNFIESTGKSLITTLLGFMSYVIEHFREVIATIVAFKAASLAMSVLQIAATLMAPQGLGLGGALGMAVLLPAAAAMTGVVAGGIAQGVLNTFMPGKASGGYVPATPGGSPQLLSEGGEGEFVIPESRMAAVMSGGMGPLMELMNGRSVSDVYPSASSSSNALYYNSVSSRSDSYGAASPGSVTNVNYYINGYTDSELRNIIRDTVNDMTYDSRLKGRYW